MTRIKTEIRPSRPGVSVPIRPEGRRCRSVDTRTRNVGEIESIAPSTFWETTWLDGLHTHGMRAVSDAERLGTEPIVIRVDRDEWTLRLHDGVIEAVAGGHATPRVEMDLGAFADWIGDRKTGLGLVIGGRVEGDAASKERFCGWDPVLRSILDGRSVYRPGEITLRALDGSSLALDQEFRLGERPEETSHFLTEAGFVHLKGVFSDDEIAGLDGDLALAVEAAHPEDGASWWASTQAGERYPCRILNFTSQSELLRKLLRDPRYLAIGEILDDGHEPGDSFGEHFSDVSAEGLVKRVGSVEGLACLPWHKDCERGGHSMYCSSLTVGICLTPVDEAHGGLDFVAGSHRANIARSQVDAGLDLPTVSLEAERGDLTLHVSCALHRSTHPASRERRVVYSGLALPMRPGDLSQGIERSALERERADIGEGRNRAPLPSGRGAREGQPT